MLAESAVPTRPFGERILRVVQFFAHIAGRVGQLFQWHLDLLAVRLNQHDIRRRFMPPNRASTLNLPVLSRPFVRIGSLGLGRLSCLDASHVVGREVSRMDPLAHVLRNAVRLFHPRPLAPRSIRLCSRPTTVPVFQSEPSSASTRSPFLHTLTAALRCADAGVQQSHRDHRTKQVLTADATWARR